MTKQLKEHFSVDSALLSELGEKLVTTPHVALAELVKNSYDADATKVYVTIGEDSLGMPTIEVKDNGHGMTLQGVRSYWMRIGTTNKAQDQHSPLYGRTRTGEKGIGRFACRRLGSILEVETCAKFDPKDIPASGDKFEKTALQFAWKDFIPGTDVAGIDVARISSTQASGPTGLRLFISGVERNEWSFRGFGYLKRQLAALCANQGCKREGHKEDPGFKVFVSAPALQEEGAVEDVREQLMNAGWGTPHAFARWIWKGLLDRPGFLYDELEAATLLGMQVAGFRKVQGLFVKCRYSGAFKSSSKMRWWASGLRRTVRKIAGDTSSTSFVELARSLLPKPQKAHLSRCHGVNIAGCIPETVAFLDGLRDPAKRVQARMEDTIADEIDTPPPGFEQRRIFKRQ